MRFRVTLICRAMYTWLRKFVSADRIHVWGHSLGTGVAAALAHFVSTQRRDVFHSLILEAPFFSLVDAAKSYPLSYVRGLCLGVLPLSSLS